MSTKPKQLTAAAGNTAETVRRRIESGGERVWRLADFDGLPFMAVAQSLSRLTRRGVILRLGKGLYYRSRQTAFGPSRPNPAEIRALPIGRTKVFPAGIAAANLLGFSTQNAARIELATTAKSLPRLIVGKESLSIRGGRSPGRHSTKRRQPFWISFATELCRASCLRRIRCTGFSNS